jgi:glycosyltransferase involved in cell wall biosynthesis
MRVSVIIPALNEAENVERCVEAARQRYPPAEVEIIVVDGSSTDGTPERVPERVTLAQAPRGGLPR